MNHLDVGSEFSLHLASTSQGRPHLGLFFLAPEIEFINFLNH